MPFFNRRRLILAISCALNITFPLMRWLSVLIVLKHKITTTLLSARFQNLSIILPSFGKKTKIVHAKHISFWILLLIAILCSYCYVKNHGINEVVVHWLFRFAGLMERYQAEVELMDRENSTYLVRHRSKECNEYAISIKWVSMHS